MPDFHLTDTGLYLKVTMSLQVPTGAFDENGEIERVPFDVSTVLDKHLALVDGLAEATVCEYLVLQLIQAMFTKLAEHFLQSQQSLSTTFSNLVVQEFDAHVQANNPTPGAPLLLDAPAE